MSETVISEDIVSPIKIKKGWGHWYSKCKQCARNDVPYGALGLCQRCYNQQAIYRDNKTCKKCGNHICNGNTTGYCIHCIKRPRTKLPVAHIKRLRHKYGYTLEAIANKLTAKYGKVTRERIRQLAGNIPDRTACPRKCRCGKVFIGRSRSEICQKCMAAKYVCPKCKGRKVELASYCMKCRIDYRSPTNSVVDTMKKLRKKGMSYYNIARVTGFSAMLCWRKTCDHKHVYRGKVIGDIDYTTRPRSPTNEQ